VTVSELAEALGMSGMGVRRHLDALAADGLVERLPCARAGPGRPPAGWKLSPSGMEMFPRRYDTLALDLLEDLDPVQATAALARRNDRQVDQYRSAMAGCGGLQERVAALAQLRDQAGYLADWTETDGGFVLTEDNCAVHRVAERHPAVCTMELALMRRVLGDDVEVTRISHAMAGDAMCAYRIRPIAAQAPAE
jgi:predicted ArsR family transcriptional regulator